MYLKLFLSSFEKKLGGGGSGGFFRSFTVTGLIIVLLIVAATAAYIEHGRGNLHKIKKHLRTPADTDSSNPRPGGLDPIVLSRTQPPSGTVPEFLSATLLPGRGMNVLQIKAFIPGLGEVNLLDAPTLDAANRAMSGVDDDSEGQASLVNGAALLLPWAGHLFGITSIDGQSSSITWKGKVLSLPANSIESPSPSAYGGLLLNDAATTVETEPGPDGGSAKAIYPSVDVEDRWPSNPETVVSFRLSGQAIEFTVDVKNTGDSTLPIGIGWAPRFLLHGGDRSKVTLHLPATAREKIRETATGLPSGTFDSVAGSSFDVSARNGAPLGNSPLNATFVHLRPAAGPADAIELRDPLAKFGLRITPLSTSIKAIHVFSPASSDFVSISPQTNFDDPFGREWEATEDTGMALVSPGQSIQWKIRLELFPLPASTK